MLAVNTGNTLSTLAEIASNDNVEDRRQSRVRFSAVVGTTYQIFVAGYRGVGFPDNEGNIELYIDIFPSNDNFADRVALPSLLPTSTIGSNVNATVELDEPYHDGRFPESSVWWSWVAPSSGTVHVDTFGSDFDTVLAVYVGTTLSTLTEIASNDNGGNGGQTRVEFFGCHRARLIKSR